MKAYDAKHYLLKAELHWERVEDTARYPFSLPALAARVAYEDTEHFTITRQLIED